MFRKCKHKWTIVNRKFTPPIPNIVKLSGPDSDQKFFTLYGFTTIEQKCTICGQIKFVHCQGNQT